MYSFSGGGLWYFAGLSLEDSLKISLGIAGIFGISAGLSNALQRRPSRRVRIYNTGVLVNFKRQDFEVRSRLINLGNSAETLESIDYLAWIEGVARLRSNIHFALAKAGSQQGIELPAVLDPNVEYDMVGHGLFISQGGGALGALDRIGKVNEFAVRLDFHFAHTRSFRVRVNRRGPIPGFNWLHELRESRLPEIP